MVEEVTDQGAHFLSAVASIIDSNDPDEIQKIIDSIPDPVGTFYRYSLPDPLLRRARQSLIKTHKEVLFTLVGNLSK